MIDQTVISAALASAITTIVLAIGYVLRKRTDTHASDRAASNEVAKSAASDQRDLTGALIKLVDKLGSMDERGSAERSQTLLTIEKLTGRMEGMTTAILQTDKRGEGVTKSIEGLVLTMDEFGGRIQHIPQMKDDVGAIKAATASLETNIGESLTGQLGPVVKALENLEKAMRDLTRELEGRDKITFEGLQKLTGLFYDAKLEFMRRISPEVEQHIDEFLTPDTPGANGKKTSDTAQNLPVNIQITPAAPKEPKP